MSWAVFDLWSDKGFSNCPTNILMHGLQHHTTNPFLELFDLSFCSIWPRSVRLQLLQLTCSIFSLLIKLTLHHLRGIIAYTRWKDAILIKLQWQSLICFILGCNWVHSGSTKIPVHIYCPFWQTLCLKILDVPVKKMTNVMIICWII